MPIMPGVKIQGFAMPYATARAQANGAVTALLLLIGTLAAQGAQMARLRARLEVGVGFAAAALAYDFYALGGGYWLG